MSQSMFATELGVRQQTVSEWETGMYRPRGASSTLLTMFASNSGFIQEGPAYAHGGHARFLSPTTSADGGASHRPVDPVRPSEPLPGASLVRPEVAI